jgi:hypothetical protein
MRRSNKAFLGAVGNLPKHIIDHTVRMREEAITPIAKRFEKLAPIIRPTHRKLSERQV